MEMRWFLVEHGLETLQHTVLYVTSYRRSSLLLLFLRICNCKMDSMVQNRCLVFCL